MDSTHVWITLIVAVVVVIAIVFGYSVEIEGLFKGGRFKTVFTRNRTTRKKGEKSAQIDPGMKPGDLE